LELRIFGGAIACCALLASCATGAFAYSVDGDLDDWGTWSQDAAGKWSFDITDTTERLASDVEFATTWDLTDGVITDMLPSPYSGGEWFDIEGLYMDISAADSKLYLNWALITSYAGLEPYCRYYTNSEWTPRFDGVTGGEPDPSADTGYYNPGHGTYAAERDGDNDLGWSYRKNPVIGISLDNDTDYEWGLILDPADTQTRGDITSGAQLYSISNPAAWQQWYAGAEYPLQESSVDFDTSADGVMQRVTGAAGTSVRRFGYFEPKATQLYPDHIWHQAYNWVWEGALDITALSSFIPLGDQQFVHYSMWCGNDGALAVHEGAFKEPPSPTPELPSGALLLLGAMPLAWSWWRKSRS